MVPCVFARADLVDPSPVRAAELRQKANVETWDDGGEVSNFVYRHPSELFPAAIALMPVLLGASWVHWKNGWLFTNAGGGWEYPVFLAAATAVQALVGDGAFALRAPAGGAVIGRAVRVS